MVAVVPEELDERHELAGHQTEDEFDIPTPR